MFNYPEELKYSKTHEWVKKEGEVYVVGLSDYAQDALGDIVFVNLPNEKDEIRAGETFGDVESVKSVSEIYSPVSGIVCQINNEVIDNPALINEDPYGTWLIKINEVTDVLDLLNNNDYEKHCEEEN